MLLFGGLKIKLLFLDCLSSQFKHHKIQFSPIYESSEHSDFQMFLVQKKCTKENAFGKIEQVHNTQLNVHI